MKLQVALSAFAIALGSASAFAADADKSPAPEQRAEQPPAGSAQQHHSHVQEKTGIPQKAPAAADPKKKSPAEDRTKHYHPRDMK